MVDESSKKETGDDLSEDDYSLMILKNRLAKGEITLDEFDILKKKLIESYTITKLKDEIKNINEKMEKMQEEHANKIDRIAIESYKSEGTTTVLSLLGLIGILGVGHMYVGKTSKGVCLLIAGLIIMLIIVTLAAAWSNISNCYECGIPVEEGFAVLGFLAGLGIAYLVLFIWQILNARKLCREYNLDIHSIHSTKYSQNKTAVDFGHDEIKIKKRWSKKKTIVIVIACIFGLTLLGPLLPQPHVAPPQNQYMPIGADSPYAQELKSKFSSCVDTLGNVSKCQQILSTQAYAGQPLKQGLPP